MVLFLSECPRWLAALVLVVLPTIAAMCGTVLIRRHVGLDRLTTNNEIAGFKFATVGVIYAVLLAFAVIVVWERFEDGETAVTQEAGAAATIYRLTAGPGTEAVAVRGALTNYLELAISDDWPQMANEKESPAVTKALDALYTAAIAFTGRSSPASATYAELLKQLDSITQARRTRLHLASGIVPEVLWGVLFGGAALTVAFTFFFGTENLAAQVMMTGILTVIVFMGLFVIVSIDHPFTGPVHIDSAPLETVLKDFRNN